MSSQKTPMNVESVMPLLVNINAVGLTRTQTKTTIAKSMISADAIAKTRFQSAFTESST